MWFIFDIFMKINYINKLPDELVLNILTHLNPSDRITFLSTSESTHTITDKYDIATSNIIQESISFIKHLYEKLHRTNLTPPNISDLPDFPLIGEKLFYEKKISILKNQIIEDLSSLDKETLDSFKEIPVPDSFKHVFTSAKTNILLREIDGISPLFQATDFEDICKNLIQMEENTRAINIANAIVNDRVKSWVLAYISKIFTDNRNFELADKAAKNINDEGQKCECLYYISSYQRNV